MTVKRFKPLVSGGFCYEHNVEKSVKATAMRVIIKSGVPLAGCLKRLKWNECTGNWTMLLDVA